MQKPSTADADTDGGCIQPAGADNEVLTRLPGNLSPISGHPTP